MLDLMPLVPAWWRVLIGRGVVPKADGAISENSKSETKGALVTACAYSDWKAEAVRPTQELSCCQLLVIRGQVVVLHACTASPPPGHLMAHMVMRFLPSPRNFRYIAHKKSSWIAPSRNNEPNPSTTGSSTKPQPPLDRSQLWGQS